ncbi:MAG: HDOD domain-containing protein [Gammaproteobacteria bacterium]|nr:HDOD domain-containing protein [Gammaproteobacteria bacterium]
MTIAAAVLRHLKSNHIVFRECPHPRAANLSESAHHCDLAGFEVARTVLLRDEHGPLMAVLPLNTQIDFNRLRIATRRSLRPICGPEVDRLFPDCAPGCRPPFGELYGLPVVVERSLTDLPQVYFEPGCPSSLIRVSGKDFAFLLGRAPRAEFAALTETGAAPTCLSNEAVLELARETHYAPPDDEEVRKRLEQVYRLPAMPAVATQILSLVANPQCTAKELAELVEMDPSIAAQVIRYARSSFFGYRGSVDSIQIAITRVLGFDIVCNLAVGIAAGRLFKLPNEGPLGLNAFWRHAVYTASLAQALVRRMPDASLVKPGTAYLAGLLHNIGVLLLGHMFPPEYAFLNKLLALKPECPLPILERRLMGMGSAHKLISLGHAQMGGRLMRHWNLPEEVIAVTERHHETVVEGPATPYVRLIQVVNAVLSRQGIGDAACSEICPGWLESLGLSLEAVDAVASQLFAGGEDLDRVARLMSS